MVDAILDEIRGEIKSHNHVEAGTSEGENIIHRKDLATT